MGEAWFFNLACEDNQLLTEKSIFSDELRSTSGEVGEWGERNGMTGGLSEEEEKSFEP